MTSYNIRSQHISIGTYEYLILVVEKITKRARTHTHRSRERKREIERWTHSHSHSHLVYETRHARLVELGAQACDGERRQTKEETKGAQRAVHRQQRIQLLDRYLQVIRRNWQFLIHIRQRRFDQLAARTRAMIIGVGFDARCWKTALWHRCTGATVDDKLYIEKMSLSSAPQIGDRRQIIPCPRGNKRWMNCKKQGKSYALLF